MSKYTVVVRKLPFEMTKTQFMEIADISKVLESPGTEVRFYTPEDIGDTSAVPTSTAYVSFTDQNTAKIFEVRMANTKISKENGKFYYPPIERSPYELKTSTERHEQPVKASIEEDPDFIQFKKEFTANHANIDSKDYPELPELVKEDRTEMLSRLKSRALGVIKQSRK